MVDGVRVECSDEEEAAIRAEWAENRARKDQEAIQEALDKAEAEAHRNSGWAKLKAIGLSDKEIEHLFKK
jgi:hypothetical protein